MRRFYLIAILVSSLVIIGLALSCKQQPPPSPPDTRAADERAIREADAACWKAMTAKDVEAFVSFYAEDASLLPPNALMVTGKESVRKWASETMATPGLVGSWQTTKVEVSRAGDLAYSTDTYEVTANDAKGRPVTDRGKEVIVWKKQPDGRWKTLVDIFNSDLPAPGAAKH
jgi:uncharacterized protein (TIGR02246 family)